MIARSPSARLSRILLAFIVLILFLAIGVAEAPFFHDFAEWLYQAQILKNIVIGPEAVTGFRIATYPVPNTLATGLLAALSTAMPAILAGKLFLVLLLAGWYAVIRALVNRHVAAGSRDSITLVLIPVMALTSFFWYGFVSYQLALLLFTWYLSLDDRQINPISIALFSATIFFAHALIFLVFGLLLGVRMIVKGQWSTIYGLLPSGLLSFWFLAGRAGEKFTSPIADAQWAGLREALVYKLGYPAMMGPFKNFLLPDGSSLFENQAWIYWPGFAANFAVVSVLAWFSISVLWKSRATLWRWNSGTDEFTATLAISTATLAVLYLAAPYNFFGLINPGGRLLLPMLLMVLIIGRERLSGLVRLIFWPVATFTLITCVSYLYLVTTTRSEQIAEAHIAQGKSLPTHSVFEFNEALYANTHFKYFNYRVFAFADRFQRIETNQYDDLAFRTGLIRRIDPKQN